MVNNGMTKKKILGYILTLGLITPIGIIVGLVLTYDAESALDPTKSMAVGVLQVPHIDIKT
jgi:zinc transporter ZupT